MILLVLLDGFLAWSLAEYLVHRFVLHRLKPFRKSHMLHHKDPHAVVGVPFGYAAGISFVVMAMGFVFLGELGAATAAGAVVGYLLYVTLHEGMHRWEPPPRILKPLHRWHELHHMGHAANYGVTSPLWDIVFGTFRR